MQPDYSSVLTDLRKRREDLAHAIAVLESVCPPTPLDTPALTAPVAEIPAAVETPIPSSEDGTFAKDAEFWEGRMEHETPMEIALKISSDLFRHLDLLNSIDILLHDVGQPLTLGKMAGLLRIGGICVNPERLDALMVATLGQHPDRFLKVGPGTWKAVPVEYGDEDE